MANTITRSAITITLDIDLDWPDEFEWSAVQSRRGYSAGGALLLDTGTKLAGRPITLTGSDNRAPMTRTDMLTLRSWTDDPPSTMTLLFRGTTYSVAFAAVDAPVTCTPCAPYSDPIGADLVIPVLRFITLS